MPNVKHIILSVLLKSICGNICRVGINFQWPSIVLSQINDKPAIYFSWMITAILAIWFMS